MIRRKSMKKMRRTIMKRTRKDMRSNMRRIRRISRRRNMRRRRKIRWSLMKRSIHSSIEKVFHYIYDIKDIE